MPFLAEHLNVASSSSHTALHSDKEQDAHYIESDDENDETTEANVTARARLLMEECCKRLHVQQPLWNSGSLRAFQQLIFLLESYQCPPATRDLGHPSHLC